MKKHYDSMSEYRCECGYWTVAHSDGARLCPVCSKGDAGKYCTERKPKGQRAKPATPAKIEELKRRFSA